MSHLHFQVWYRIHRWTSLVCTLSLLLLCVTGAPLILKDEIGVWSGTTVEPPALPGVTTRASIDAMVDDARRRRPGDVVRYVSQSDDSPAWFVSLGTRADSNDATAVYKYDARTGLLIHDIEQRSGAMYLIRKLHVDLFAGLPGTLFIGAMGFMFVVSVVSGIVVYGVFMRRLPFGTVRRDRAPRLKWLDLHNLAGIATAAWLCVVGLTGTINTLAIPLLGHWQSTELAAMTAPWRGQPPVAAPPRGAQQALDTAMRAVPGMQVAFVGYPGSRFSTPHHYMVFLRGDTTLTSRLLQPVMVDAQTGALSATARLPWYLTAILIAQPLHFGDYGGFPLKVLWILLDLVAIAVLVSGLCLWWKRRDAVRARIDALRLQAAPSAVTTHEATADD
ncbi:PepSY-associated TM helix domain-containing protein [Paraburkholderia sp.]|uniref:PepSY-associated TM helix domain-containing protein n=1 Tax=Paraburkholderia sp. TaxID=1926495 RepID=UPI0039E6DF87